MAEGARVMARPADLPDYDNPPVNEVVIGVHCVPVEITGAHVELSGKRCGLISEGLRATGSRTRIEILQPLRFRADVAIWFMARLTTLVHI